MLGNTKILSGNELDELGFQSQIQVGDAQQTASISGRLLTANGRAVSRAVVTLIAQNGSVKYATTNPFGYYRFDQIAIGNTYNIKVNHKGFLFHQETILLETHELI